MHQLWWAFTGSVDVWVVRDTKGTEEDMNSLLFCAQMILVVADLPAPETPQITWVESTPMIRSAFFEGFNYPPRESLAFEMSVPPVCSGQQITALFVLLGKDERPVLLVLPNHTDVRPE